MIKQSKRLLAASSIALITLVQNVAHADVILTFAVTDVVRNVCSGALQPSCTASSVAGFQETMTFITGAPLATPSGSSGASFLQSQAYYAFADFSSGSPYTPFLSSRLSGPVTSGQTFTQLDSNFDTGLPGGTSAALIQTDGASDVTDSIGVRTQQEYKRSYNLFSNLFTDPAFYTDLVSESLTDFFNKYAGNMSGFFDELGSVSVLDPLSLELSTYDFTEYTGNVALLGARAVPEPSSFSLLCIGAIALGRYRRLRARGRKFSATARA